MNKKLFKLFSLILVVLVVATGCQDNNGKIKKLKKQEDITNNSERIKQENINHYYSLNYSKFKSKEKLMDAYNENVDTYSKNSKTIYKDENNFEVFQTIPAGESMSTEETYSYALFIKNDKELIELSDYTYEKDTKYMEEISKDLKKYVSKYSSLKEAYDEFCKDNNLTIYESPYQQSELDNLGLEFYSSSANRYTVVQYNESGLVDKVVLENIDISGGETKILAVAKTKNNKKVWSLDLGINDKLSALDKDTLFVSMGNKYVYLGYDLIFEARDIQTGKLVWRTDEQVGYGFKRVIEVNDKVYALVVDKDSIDNIYVFDSKGNELDFIDLSPYSYKYLFNNVDNAKVEGNYITVDIYKDSKTKKVNGKLKININDNSVNYEKIN